MRQAHPAPAPELPASTLEPGAPARLVVLEVTTCPPRRRRTRRAIRWTAAVPAGFWARSMCIHRACREDGIANHPVCVDERVRRGHKSASVSCRASRPAFLQWRASQRIWSRRRGMKFFMHPPKAPVNEAPLTVKKREPSNLLQRETHVPFSAKPAEVVHEWFVVDATDKVLGRVASRSGPPSARKHKPFTRLTSIPVTSSSSSTPPS